MFFAYLYSSHHRHVNNALYNVTCRELIGAVLRRSREETNMRYKQGAPQPIARHGYSLSQSITRSLSQSLAEDDHANDGAQRNGSESHIDRETDSQSHNHDHDQGHNESHGQRHDSQHVTDMHNLDTLQVSWAGSVAASSTAMDETLQGERELHLGGYGAAVEQVEL